MAAGKYSSAEIFELQANASQFAKWDENEEDADFVAHAKKAAMIALAEELTDKQKKYYVMYHLNNLSIPEIAEMEGVNKSTVSRTITRAAKRLAKVLRYSAPHLLNASAPARNKRDNHGR